MPAQRPKRRPATPAPRRLKSGCQRKGQNIDRQRPRREGSKADASEKAKTPTGNARAAKAQKRMPAQRPKHRPATPAPRRLKSGCQRKGQNTDRQRPRREGSKADASAKAKTSTGNARAAKAQKRMPAKRPKHRPATPAPRRLKSACQRKGQTIDRQRPRREGSKADASEKAKTPTGNARAAKAQKRMPAQ